MLYDTLMGYNSHAQTSVPARKGSLSSVEADDERQITSTTTLCDFDCSPTTKEQGTKSYSSIDTFSRGSLSSTAITTVHRTSNGGGFCNHMLHILRAGRRLGRCFMQVSPRCHHEGRSATIDYRGDPLAQAVRKFLKTLQGAHIACSMLSSRPEDADLLPDWVVVQGERDMPQPYLMQEELVRIAVEQGSRVCEGCHEPCWHLHENGTTTAQQDELLARIMSFMR
jgi:hypothetical protein